MIVCYFAGLFFRNVRKYWIFWKLIASVPCNTSHKSKTNIFFSKSTLAARKKFIKDALGVPEIRSYENYLGLPYLIGRRKKASFEYIKERVWKKLQVWEEKLLS